ncbi:hypothetical protein ABFV58_31080, partial [Pseudomonas protegens]
MPSSNTSPSSTLAAGIASSSQRARPSQIREQVDGLQNSVQEAAALDDLKQVLESHLEGLLGT